MSAVLLGARCFFHPAKSLPAISICFAILGGLFFSELDRFLNSKGAFHRKVATTKGYVARLRRGFNKKLTVKHQKHR